MPFGMNQGKPVANPSFSMALSAVLMATQQVWFVQQAGQEEQELTSVILFPVCKLPWNHDTKGPYHCFPADPNAQCCGNNCQDEVY